MIAFQNSFSNINRLHSPKINETKHFHHVCGFILETFHSLFSANRFGDCFIMFAICYAISVLAMY